jgi:hypothetical protein
MTIASPWTKMQSNHGRQYKGAQKHYMLTHIKDYVILITNWWNPTKLFFEKAPKNGREKETKKTMTKVQAHKKTPREVREKLSAKTCTGHMKHVN